MVSDAAEAGKLKTLEMGWESSGAELLPAVPAAGDFRGEKVSGLTLRGECLGGPECQELLSG